MNKNSFILAKDVIDTYYSHDLFPVDSAKICTQMNIKVLELDLGNTFLSGIRKQKDKDAVIILSNNESKGSLRFNCAYQLGVYFNSKPDFYSLSTSYDNKFALLFAKELLMPAAKVNEFLKQDKGVIFFSMYFGLTIDRVNVLLNDN